MPSRDGSAAAAFASSRSSAYDGGSNAASRPQRGQRMERTATVPEPGRRWSKARIRGDGEGAAVTEDAPILSLLRPAGRFRALFPGPAPGGRRAPAGTSGSMERLTRARLDEILEKSRGLRVAVVGDVMLDVYLVGAVSRISPEAPVPVVHVTEERFALGG